MASASNSPTVLQSNIREPVNPYVALAIRASIVGVAGAGLLIFAKTSRTFRQFRHVNEIPTEYYQKGVEIRGRLKEIAMDGTLRVEHVPTIRLPRPLGPRYSKSAFLNIRLAGVDVFPSGITHMDKTISTRLLTFVPIVKSTTNVDAADAEIFFKKSSLFPFLPRTNVGIDLVRRGFARVHTADKPVHAKLMQANRVYARLVTRLLASEDVADRRGMGNWRRQLWMEKVGALPSTYLELAKGSALTKFMILIYHLVWDLSLLLYIAVKQCYHLGKALLGYACAAYARFAQFIDRIVHLYARIRSRLHSSGAPQRNQIAGNDASKAKLNRA